jgi:hypothetical protein
MTMSVPRITMMNTGIWQHGILDRAVMDHTMVTQVSGVDKLRGRNRFAVTSQAVGGLPVLTGTDEACLKRIEDERGSNDYGSLQEIEVSCASKACTPRDIALGHCSTSYIILHPERGILIVLVNSVVPCRRETDPACRGTPGFLLFLIISYLESLKKYLAFFPARVHFSSLFFDIPGCWTRVSEEATNGFGIRHVRV